MDTCVSEHKLKQEILDNSVEKEAVRKLSFNPYFSDIVWLLFLEHPLVF